MVIPLERPAGAALPTDEAKAADSTQTAQRLELLQTEVKILLEQAAINATAQRALLDRLQKAEEARERDAFVYWLAGLLILCMAGMAVFMRRASTQIRNLENERLSHALKGIPVQTDTQLQKDSHAPTPDAGKIGVVEDSNWFKVDVRGLSVMVDGNPTGPAALEAAEVPTAPAMDDEVGTTDFNSEHQFALIDQAHLFVRLDKTAQAIDVLEDRIRTKASDCPLVFLEALRISHEFSLKVDFRQFRDEMHQVFNVAVPEFAYFTTEGRGLNSYPAILAQLERLGQTPQALRDIESWILRSPTNSRTEALDLAAFKALVLRHGVILHALQTARGVHQRDQADGTGRLSEVDLPL